MGSFSFPQLSVVAPTFAAQYISGTGAVTVILKFGFTLDDVSTLLSGFLIVPETVIGIGPVSSTAKLALGNVVADPGSGEIEGVPPIMLPPLVGVFAFRRGVIIGSTTFRVLCTAGG
jgi:hypothetical protein